MRTYCYPHGIVEGGCRKCPPWNFPQARATTRDPLDLSRPFSLTHSFVEIDSSRWFS